MKKNCYYLIPIFLLLFVTESLPVSKLLNVNNNAKVIYVSPMPGAKYVTPETNIIIKTSGVIDKYTTAAQDVFDVTGSVSGKHTGKVIFSDDGHTILFNSYIPFNYGETVNVKLNTGLKTTDGDDVALPEFNFEISKQNQNLLNKPGISDEFTGYNPLINNSNNSLKQNAHKIISTVQTLPSDFPALTVNQSNNPSSGYLFLSDYRVKADSQYGDYLIVADNQGNPVFYKKINGLGLDFKIQPTGVVTYFDEGTNKHYVMNTSFDVIDSITCRNGYVNNAHELRILPDGHIFLLCSDVETVDMSKIIAGGDTAAQVTGNVIQELDKNKNVVFEWRTWDHFKITDATHEDLTAHNIDYVHANAIEIDNDGNILLSSRHMDEITKINIQTGDIIWRLGGKNNQFTFVNDTVGFSHQHSIRRLPNGDITLFDDGNFHTPQFSRAVEYKLDEVNKTATLVWQYRNSPDIYGFAMGYVQRLENGNTLIGWGATNPSVTEVTPDGKVALEMDLPQGIWSYRAYRFPFVFIDSTLAGKNLLSGSSTNITWQSSGVDTVNIDYSIDDGKTWNNITTNYSAASNSYKWNVPDVASALCKIRISDRDDSEPDDDFISDSTFTIQTVASSNTNAVAYAYNLEDNYPNPFNPSTIIKYELAANSKVVIDVYNSLGQLVEEVENSVQSAGSHSLSFNAKNLSSGVYFDSIRAVSLDGKQKYVSVRKMMLLK